MKNALNILLCGAAAFVITAQASAAPPAKACWGQATAVFAQMGVMGEHASQQQEPRLGLAGLAQALFEAGILPEPTLAALGAFVTAELGLNVDACLAQQEAVMAAEATAAAHAACWGQASAVFARMGVMGEHASGQKEPRLGLRRLAKALFEMGLIPDDSMASLGVFVATELGLEIAACL